MLPSDGTPSVHTSVQMACRGFCRISPGGPGECSCSLYCGSSAALSMRNPGEGSKNFGPQGSRQAMLTGGLQGVPSRNQLWHRDTGVSYMPLSSQGQRCGVSLCVLANFVGYFNREEENSSTRELPQHLAQTLSIGPVRHHRPFWTFLVSQPPPTVSSSNTAQGCP